MTSASPTSTAQARGAVKRAGLHSTESKIKEQRQPEPEWHSSFILDANMFDSVTPMLRPYGSASNPTNRVCGTQSSSSRRPTS